MQKTKLLFITWDSPQTTYMEGLFMPIFHEITKFKSQYEFHVLQFTWANDERVYLIKEKAISLGVIYNSYRIQRKLHPILGSLYTLWNGRNALEKYIFDNNIDIVMPRSTFPAIMINSLNLKKIRIIFDADGLPIEERVDFSNLKKNSLQYRIFKNAETKILRSADAIITRTNKAIDIHVRNIGESYRDKFFKVTNGIDTNIFKIDLKKRIEIRNLLGLESNTMLFVYSGSLGAQYCIEEMLNIFEKYLEHNEKSQFLILSGNISYLNGLIPDNMIGNIILKSVSNSEVIDYLNAADIAFAIRKPLYSMMGVSPIKIGEYLLAGLPVIASKGIGDTEDILSDLEGCFIYDHSDTSRVEKACLWLENEKWERPKISTFAKSIFSLRKSMEDYCHVIEYLNL
ncbi:glycosyltransferase involved in cell wall biosynthesis [Dysgonomonas sp. PFB1-18]|uniref:glycosyltransferase n=1 Tax=unclassified Dysgonomonas TaxID=2630389 RepID=UPI0024750B92|nr:MULTISPECIES: glycosyltransferase [unclassified Dysgonomonas]MDH6307770.1 glycosyltransferase involved in cell wall biosynthesis [Dysgonomonas sp. PF1-14]MDH6337688.1 glycosyltransferase involved in cell wall biosynthesis [Dysgonomonas sp. PF1-16]MDH6378912.1 glycosyltransferase involved in cell wall biosynthesis [Dysgonomonas sp. PFB1-18]MDH6396547.1 glycosyltransferase involved in cell wall biosynthesis [Dysgonomonas sp. PF1-23]